jgi:hypothetical protein
MPIRPVTDPSAPRAAQPGAGHIVANPMFPSQLQSAQGQAAAAPYAAPQAAAQLNRTRTEAGVAAATAPADIKQKNANARQTEAQAQTAEANLATTGGANEGQAKSASFYTRAYRANKMYEGTGIKDQPAGRSIALALLPDAAVNEFTSPQRQTAEAAQRDFIASTLRYESGANIPQNEFELQKSIYFPAPGDSPTVIAAKAQLRKNALDGLRVASGPAAPLLDTNPLHQAAGDVSAPQLGIGDRQNGRRRTIPKVAAQIDKLIRMGRPPHEIAAFAQSRGFTTFPHGANRGRSPALRQGTS